MQTRSGIGIQTRIITALLLLAAPPVWATDYPSTASSSTLSFNLNGSVSVTVNTTGGSDTQNTSFNTSLTVSHGGGIVVDWGEPGWNDSLLFEGVALDSQSIGSVHANVLNFAIAGFTPSILLDLSLEPVEISLTNVFATALSPSEAVAGSGPWTFSDTGDFDLMAGFLVDVLPSFGAQQVAAGQIGPNTVSGVSVSGELRRDGPSASELETLIGRTAFSGMVQHILATPGCEFPIPLPSACALDITSIDVDTTLSFTNVQFQSVGSSATPIPEPATGLLLAGGLLAIAARRR